MAYSIRYSRQIRRKRKPDLRPPVSVTALILALLLRMFAAGALDALQGMVLGEGGAVAAFCEDFVKHELTP